MKESGILGACFRFRYFIHGFYFWNATVFFLNFLNGFTYNLDRIAKIFFLYYHALFLIVQISLEMRVKMY